MAMPRTLRLLFPLSALLAGCGSSYQDCVDGCPAGQVCFYGACVPADDASERGGEIPADADADADGARDADATGDLRVDADARWDGAADADGDAGEGEGDLGADADGDGDAGEGSREDSFDMGVDVRPDADGGPDTDADAGSDADADGDTDGRIDGEARTDDAEEVDFDPCAPARCGPAELCGESGHGDGIDNDCDGAVDESCFCGAIDTTQECFPGDPLVCPVGAPCRGACTRGVETCTEFGTWTPCWGAVTPQAERCDGVDNDCDGLYDEGIFGCDAPVSCPSTTTAAPMSPAPLDGSSIFFGAYDSWLWELFCPPTVATCPTPDDPTARDTHVLLIASGTYRARATIRVGASTYTCEYAIVAGSPGLRVEMNWDTQGSDHGDTDVDLHLHQWGTGSGFFAAPQDCYYADCKASSCCWGGVPAVDWGLTHSTDLAACRDAPHGEGAQWVTLGYCANPRLDVDIISCTTGVTDPTDPAFCAPENINIDNPPPYRPMRILVNYYSAHSFTGVTNASVNIYCGGELRATLGQHALSYGGSYGEDNDSWLAADVQFYETTCGMLGCEIVPLDVIQRGSGFGPPWSMFVHSP